MTRWPTTTACWSSARAWGGLAGASAGRRAFRPGSAGSAASTRPRRGRPGAREEGKRPLPPLPLDRARVAREGSDATVVAYGPTVQTALAAADTAAGEGVSLEVIDLRSLAPLDMDTLAASVRKTRRAVVVHEAPVFMGMGAGIAARLMHDLFDVLG